jgi:hypothetical protein
VTVSPGDSLYAVRPDDFVAARTALVTQLKAAGRKDEAAAVAKLRRPSVAAWALNQVAREYPQLVAAAVDAGQQLRAASAEAVAGRPGELRAATAAERTAATAVVKAAAVHLGTRADATTPALLATLRVAAFDEEVADQLRRGVLTTEQEQPGFGFGLDAEVAPAPARKPNLTLVPSPKPTTKAKRKASAEEVDPAQVEREKTERATAREAERLRKKELAARRRTAERKEREAARLAKEADEADAAAREARAAAEGAQQAATEARRAADELEKPD